MAEPLKNHFGVDIPGRIGGMIRRISPAFDHVSFVRDALDGYEVLELMPRGRKIARALQRHLPADYEAAIAILIESIGPNQANADDSGMASFLYLPHVFFVAEYGLEHFEISMHAQYQLTQRFTAEYSIRPFLQKYPEATLARLRRWTQDPSPHVRRLVSEGTRPRLPWAPRLPEFQKDPRPVLALLELLKDDPDPYVRRSVANNLNDIGKDHPALLVETARKWLTDAPDERRWLVRHALRSAVKRAEPGALALMGFGKEAQVSVDKIGINPERAVLGSAVEIAFQVRNTDSQRQRLLLDLRIHFVKASGKCRPKVFKLRTLDLAPGETIQLRKSVSLAELTTRKHYAGIHKVEAVVNGRSLTLGQFELLPKQSIES